MSKAIVEQFPVVSEKHSQVTLPGGGLSVSVFPCNAVTHGKSVNSNPRNSLPVAAALGSE